MKTRHYHVHIRRAEVDRWHVLVWLYRGRFHFRKFIASQTEYSHDDARLWGMKVARDHAYRRNFEEAEYTYKFDVEPDEARPWSDKSPPPRPDNPLPPMYE